jgi:hypothetical protein
MRKVNYLGIKPPGQKSAYMSVFFTQRHKDHKAHKEYLYKILGRGRAWRALWAPCDIKTTQSYR